MHLIVKLTLDWRRSADSWAKFERAIITLNAQDLMSARAHFYWRKAVEVVCL